MLEIFNAITEIPGAKTPDVVLEQLGIEVFTLDGWQFFSFFAEHIQELREDNGAWFSACQAGVSRSADMNLLFRIAGLPTASKERSADDTSLRGISYPTLVLKIVEGEWDKEKNKAIPSGFSAGFNRLVVFLRSNDFDTSQLRRHLAAGLSEIAEKVGLEKLDNFKIIIVNEDEGPTRDMITLLSNGLSQDKKPKELADAIRNNPLFNHLAGQ